MLYLVPPYYIIKGISVMRDHQDPLQWYYLPVSPHLTQILNPATGKRVPQIQLLEYKGRAGTGGFLNFDVDLGVDAKTLDDVRDEIASQERLRGQPRLAPIQLIDGSVKVMLFDSQSGDPPPEGGEPPRKWVTKISQGAKPSLYGDNAATFSISLDQNGVVALRKALEGEMSPIGIVYSLDYLALRPAYDVRLNIDWDRVQKHLQDSFGYEGLFASVEIDKSVDELIDQRAITFEVDSFVTEDEDPGVIGRRDQAVNDVRDMITNSFFEPSLKPDQDKPDGWDKFTHLAERSVGMATTGGWGAVIGTFSWKKIDYTRVDRKILNVRMTERTTVKRSIYPQRHLRGLFSILAEEGLDPGKFILQVDLDDPWFDRRKVTVISRGDFAADSIGSINVRMNYNNRPNNVILESSTDKKDLDWSSVVTDGAMQRDVKYTYKVTFKGVDGSERPLALESTERVETGDGLEINPRELYNIVVVPIRAEPGLEDSPNYLWKRYPRVEAHVRYMDEANGIRMTDTFFVDEGNSEQTWNMFVRDPSKRAFDYKLVYLAADHKDVATAWTTTAEEVVTVRDPFPRKLTLDVVPQFPWAEVDRAFVDITYDDPENDIQKSESFEFSEQANTTQVFRTSFANPDLRVVTYRVSILYKDGRLLEIPRSMKRIAGERDRIILRSDLRGQKLVQVHTQPVDFATKKIKSVTVELRYRDDDFGLAYDDRLELTSSAQREYFEYVYANEEHDDYEYRVVYRFLNNPARTTQWKRTDEEELIVPVG